MLLLSFNWKSTVSRVPQGRRSEGHGTSWHRTARLRRAWTSIFSNYAHSRRPWRGSTDRQPEGPCTPSDLSPRILLQLSGMSMAAEPRATPPAAPAADPTVSLRLAFEANRGTPPSATSVGDGMSHASRTTASAVRRLL